MLKILVNLLVPVLAGLTYFIMAYETKRLGQIRALIFGEIAYKKVFIAYLLFGIYLITRPLQNILGPHPWPMLVNCLRQFFLMGIISPAILVGIFHWASNDQEIPKTVEVASYILGIFMAVIFILINIVAIDGSKIIAEYNNIQLYDAEWFLSGHRRLELVLVHLIVQSISPVGFLLLAAGYVRHKRHNFSKNSVYNQMPKKWWYLETGLMILAVSFILAGFSALFGSYYTYLWVIYFIGAILSGIIELAGIKIPPRLAPSDLK